MQGVIKMGLKSFSANQHDMLTYLSVDCPNHKIETHIIRYRHIHLVL